MPKTCLSVLTLLLSAALLNARNSSKPCGLAYQMQQAELPQDIAVKADALTSGGTKIAMDWWVARLSTSVRPTTWHTVQGLDECMIYIRHGWENMMSHNWAAGYTHMPDSENYDGIATVKLVDAWVVAHEVGHLIGCRHGAGVMRKDYTSGDQQLWIDDSALHFALLARIKASSRSV